MTKDDTQDQDPEGGFDFGDEAEAEPEVDPEEAAEGLSEDELEELLDGNTITINGENVTLRELAMEVNNAHRELDALKAGALETQASIEQRAMLASMNQEMEVVQLLNQIKQSSFFLYLRITRGDDELQGKRDGEFSGLLAQQEPEMPACPACEDGTLRPESNMTWVCSECENDFPHEYLEDNDLL